MTTYTVHAARMAEPEADPLGLVFVKEGFCWPALLIPVPWLLFRMLWLGLAVYVVGVVLIGLSNRVLGDTVMTGLAVLFAVVFALEANQFRRRALARRGWRFIGVAEGRNRIEAEQRYFSQMEYGTLPPPSPPRRPPPSAFPTASGPAIVGLFPSAGSGR